MLAPDVVILSDAGGLKQAARKPVVGADKVARFFLGLMRKYGYPDGADPEQINKVMLVVLLTYLVALVTAVYGPIAAMLVEMFPIRIRYTSMSLPYHIGNGWFGGFLPTLSFAMIAVTGNIYDGLWYPILICLVTVAIGAPFVRETRHNDINR